MPQILLTNDQPAFKEATLAAFPKAAFSGCHKQEPPKLKVPVFNIKDEFIAYASPDSTYAVTRRLLDNAKKEIIIGIYDFSAGYMKDILLNAKARGVKVSVMLDVKNSEKLEIDIFEALHKMGCTVVQAPSCSSRAKKHFFDVCHEKIIVIDNEWALIQSGNYSNHSIPKNESDGVNVPGFVTGNRDMGIAIRSKPLAAFFSKLVNSDMKLELDGLAPGKALPTAASGEMNPDLVEKAPTRLPSKLFPSKTFKPATPIKVTPVLTPDNYMDLIPGFLAGAKESICIENQYIRGSQTEITKLLEAIKKAKENNPGLTVQIILGKIFGKDDFKKEQVNIKNLESKFGLTLGKNIRYINLDRFVHCHNKVIIIDGKSVLVSSQNWSDTAVATNREAGLLIEYPDLARYYKDIFESDWSTAFKEIPDPGPATRTLQEVAAGNFIKVESADYEEV